MFKSDNKPSNCDSSSDLSFILSWVNLKAEKINLSISSFPPSLWAIRKEKIAAPRALTSELESPIMLPPRFPICANACSVVIVVVVMCVNIRSN